MPTFSYRAKQSGYKKEIKSDIEAATVHEAEKILVQRGMIPISVKLKDGKSSSSGGFRNKVKTKDKILFSRQLATLINAGMPLVQSLHTVEGQTAKDAMKKAIARVTNDVEGGRTLSESMEKMPEVFSNVYTNLVGAGEISGTLDKALERLANQQEKDAAITSKVKGAMVYPAIVLLVISGVVVFMLTSVLPQVELLYDDLDKELPFLTRMLLSLSDMIKNFWWVGLILLVAFVFGMRAWVKTEGGRRFFDRFKMRVPLFGKLMKKLYMARFARTTQTLMASSVPLLQALDITGDAVNNVHVKESINKAAQEVKGGKNLGQALDREIDTFLPLVPQMVSIGEKSGDLDTMVGKAADYYENELEEQVKAISTIIEPILMVVLALVAGGMVAAILMPVYGLIGENVGG